MSGLFKDDLTVALDEVDRTASRILTIYHDLAGLTDHVDRAERLQREGERLRQALTRFNDARRAAGQVPEVADPERAHLQSLWLALKSAVSGGSEQQLDESLKALRDELAGAVAAARALRPPPGVDAALRRLGAASDAPP